MATSSISLPIDVDVSKLTLAPPISLDNGGKIIRLLNNGKPLVFQTPVMNCPYGVSCYDFDKNPNAKHTMNLSFKEGHDDLRLMLERLDERLITDGFDNSMSWFKKKLATKDVVEALYAPIIKFSKDKDTGETNTKYPPTFRLQVPMKDGKIACEIYNTKKEKVEMSSTVMKGAKIAAIVQCSGIWIAGGKFGCNFKIVQMRVTLGASTLKSYAFLEDERMADEAN